MAKQKYYVVWKGRKSGVFDSWDQCSAQVTGFAGAEYKAFQTLEEARKAFAGAYSDHVVKGVARPAPQVEREDLKQRLDRLIQQKKIGAPSIAVDAACEGNPGNLEYRGVDLNTAEVVFAHGPFARGTNNIGEFLAIVAALELCNQRRLTIPIYSDSRIAIGWVEAGKCKTNLEREPRNAELFRRISHAEDWLANNIYANPILKWETEDWGENPADYGRK